ncbi:MAG: alpha/beta fold hydrolase [Streptosporangiaceae bacterium]
MISSSPASAGRAVTSPAPDDFAAPWGARGYVTDLDGPVYWIEFSPAEDHAQDLDHARDLDRAQDRDGNPDKAWDLPIVFVHGLGGSHLNWCLIGPALAAGRRVVALDLHGFGLTPGTRADATVQANRRLLDRFVREVIGRPVILVGNSMGGLITILEASAAPDIVRGAVLIDPALPLPPQKPDWAVSGTFLAYLLPGLGELFVKRVLDQRSPEQAVRELTELCFADPSRAQPQMTAAEVALAAKRQSGPPRDKAFLAAARSLLLVLSRRGRYREMMGRIAVPVLLIGGDADRLVPVAAMRQAAARFPRWESVILAGVGHAPQLEVPDVVAATIRDWLSRHFR